MNDNTYEYTFTLAEKDADGFWKILGEGIPHETKVRWDEPVKEEDDGLEIPVFMRRKNGRT